MTNEKRHSSGQDRPTLQRSLSPISNHLHRHLLEESPAAASLRGLRSSGGAHPGEAPAPRTSVVRHSRRTGHVRASPAHASDTGLQPDSVGGLDVLLRHLLGPHRLRPAPGRLLQLQPRSHGRDRKGAGRAGRLPAPPPPPPERVPAPASRKKQALPLARGPVNHLRAPQPPRPPAPSLRDQPQSAAATTRQLPRLRTLEV